MNLDPLIKIKWYIKISFSSRIASFKFIFSLMKTNNYVPNKNNIYEKKYTDLENKEIPYLEIYPEIAPRGFEVILFHGATPYGEKHPAMINLALALANSGIKVYIPKLPKLTELEINNYSVDLINKFYLYIVRKKYHINIIPAGISFGGGLLLRALVKDEVKKNLPKSILTYGTYYSLVSSIEFLLSGKIKINGREKYVKPNDWGLVVLFHNYLSEINAGFDTSQIEKILKLRVNNKISESESELKKLPYNQKEIIIDIFNSNQSSIIKKMTKEIKSVYRNEMENISPSNICDKIKFKVFLMHGANDSMVPYTESIKLNENIKNSQLFISGLYEHREISSGNSIFQKLSEMKLMSNFLTDFIDYNEN
tara:strand:- start:751 stop:1851 length:1101 start_codon:yes stop_codon:yes gene_type:complete